MEYGPAPSQAAYEDTRRRSTVHMEAGMDVEEAASAGKNTSAGTVAAHTQEEDDR